MRLRRSLALAVGLVLVLAVQSTGQSAPQQRDVAHRARIASAGLPENFVPATIRARQLGRYFVQMEAPAVADAVLKSGASTSAPQRIAAAGALRAQEGAIAQAKSLGGTITFRYKVLVNAFSAQLSAKAAAALAQRSDVRSVQPVSIVRMSLTTSVPFIGADQVWNDFGVRGEGMKVALVDTGIDYTHASFGGEGPVEAYEANDPTFIEPDSFPTSKVIGGFDFVGNDYDVLDADPTNDVPHPDFDPLDSDGHGTHTAGTIGATGDNNVGVVGVAWGTRTLACKFLNSSGSGTDAGAIECFNYVVALKQRGINIRVTSNSWGEAREGEPAAVLKAAIEQEIGRAHV